ncbi:MAG TPA: hypothetical protein ENI23_08580 [bacterium]|nr:hypothetical protein [bacterium]
MARRQTEGSETWKRLLEWDRDQKASERISLHIVRFEGYTCIDPSHPLGGKDGKKDAVCLRDNHKWIVACYFPRGQQDFKITKEKFKSDMKGITKNDAIGIAFVTNQELRTSERKEMILCNEGFETDIFHLERVANILDDPFNYGTRLEFLDIEMTKEEQLSYFSAMNKKIEEIHQLILRAQKSEPINIELERIRDEMNANKESVKNEPRYGIPIEHSIYSVDPSPLLMRCSYCNYGYLIPGYRHKSSATVGYGSNMFACPKCGNVK